VSTLKKSCADDFKSHSVKDTTIWRWKETIITKTTSALIKMGFFGGKNERKDDQSSEHSGGGHEVP
jgi:hypothetical protein